MQKLFSKLYASHFLSECGRGIYFVSITWILYTMTEDPLYTGLLVSLGFLPGMILNPLLGVWVDRSNRKRLAVIANTFSSLLIALLLFTIWVDVLHPWIILFTHMFLQLAGSLMRPSIQAFISEVVPSGLLPKVYSQSGAAGIVGGLVGSAAGGLLIAKTTGFISISASFIAYLIAAILLNMISYRVTANSDTSITTSVWSDLSSGFHYMRHHTLLLRLFSIMFTGQLTFHSSIAFLSVYTIEYLERSSTTYGLLDACLSLGGVLAGMVGAWWWKKTGQYVAIVSLTVMMFGLVSLAFAPNLFISFAGVMLIGLGTTWVRVMLQSVQQIVTEKEYHGRMASYRMMVNQSSVVISGPILGLAAAQWGVSSVYLLLLIPASFGMISALGLRKRHAYKQAMSA